jgi:glyceraldehyde 3-phosphate dehydrogenase
MTQNKIKVGINGFGRIGRLAMRVILESYSDKIEIIAINDLTTPENLAYLYNNDTTYRKPNTQILLMGGSFKIKDSLQEIKLFANKEPILDQWKDVDILLECTGFFLTSELATLHLNAGAKKIILSAPAKDDTILTELIGVTKVFDKSAKIVSNASCTTNCVTPILSGLIEELDLRGTQIKSVTGLTIHALTATQNIQDGVSSKDFRSGRSAFVNMIPSKTGAQKSTIKLLPKLENKFSLSSLRVPIITGSVVYLNIVFDGVVTKNDLESMLQIISLKEPKVIEYSLDELVSSDIIQNTHSCIIDSLQTSVTNNVGQIVLWYDNEWGYANRLVEMILV